jgi:hypothetical protein
MVSFLSVSEVLEYIKKMMRNAAEITFFAGVMGSEDPKKAEILKKIEEKAREIMDLLDGLRELVEKT